MPWQAHQRDDGSWFVQNPAYAQVTATGLTEIQAGQMAEMLNQASGEAVGKPACEQAEWWDLMEPNR